MNFSYQKDYWINFAKKAEINELGADLHNSWNSNEKKYTEHTPIPEDFKNLISTKRVLDFGIGMGRNSEYLLSSFDEVYGFDTEEMIKAGKAIVNEKVKLISNFDKIKQQPFDLIYQSICMQHMPPNEVLYYLMCIAFMSPYFFSYTRTYNDFGRDFRNNMGGVNMHKLIDSLNLFTLVKCSIKESEISQKMDETHYVALYKSNIFQ